MTDTVVRRRLNWPMALILLVILAGVWWFVSIALVMYFGGLLAFCGGAAGGVVVAWAAAWFFDPWIWVVEDEAPSHSREPRVWLDGDEVPAGVFTFRTECERDDEDAVEMLGFDGEPCGNGNLGPLLEIVLPDDIDAIVERARAARGVTTP